MDFRPLTPIDGDIEPPPSGYVKEKVARLRSDASTLEGEGKPREAITFLRAAYNFLASSSAKDAVKLPMLLEIITKIAFMERDQTGASNSLTYFQRTSVLEAEVFKKSGALGSPSILNNVSEGLCAKGQHEEAVEVAKRSIDLMFRKYSSAGKVTELPLPVLREFVEGWRALARAEEQLFLSQSSTSPDRTKDALQILVHFRRAVKCCRELLPDDTELIASTERMYNLSKKTLSRYTADAPKELMPASEAAYPGDKSGKNPFKNETKVDVKSEGASPRVAQSHPQPAPKKDTASDVSSRSTNRSYSLGREDDSPFLKDPRHKPVGEGSPSARKPAVLEPLQSTPAIRKSSEVTVVHTVDRRASRVGLPPILLSCNVRRGLQVLFLVAEKKKRRFSALQAVYMHVREAFTTFPLINLSGQSRLLEATEKDNYRLDAMANGEGKVQSEIANRIKKRQTAEEIKRKRQDEAQVELFANMDKRTQQQARRYRAVVDQVSRFLRDVFLGLQRAAFRKWLAWIKPRRQLRPLRRAAAHLFKQIDRQLLRRRYVTWLRWLKNKRLALFSGVRRRSQVEKASLQRTLQMITEQEEADEAERKKEEDEQRRSRREEEERQWAIRREEEEERLRLETEERFRKEEEEKLQPVTVPKFLNDNIPLLLATLQNAPSVEDADNAKANFLLLVKEYIRSPDFEDEVESLPASADTKGQMEELLAPLFILLVEDETFHTDENLRLVREMLKLFSSWVNFHSIFFEHGVLTSAARNGDTLYVEILLSSIPGFQVQSIGRYFLDLVTACVQHETEAVELMEILVMKCDTACPFVELRDIVSPYLHQFFDRWVPSTTRSLSQRRRTLYDPASESEVRERVKAIFERILLDTEQHAFPHELEYCDKQTLLSRMCSNGDEELVSLYLGLVSADIASMLLERRQSDDTTCFVQAVRSNSISVVQLLLSEYEECQGQLSQSFDQLTVLEIARARGANAEMIALLKSYGAVEADRHSDHSPMSNSRPSSTHSRMSNLFGDSQEMSDIDDLYSNHENEDDVLFSSPRPPSYQLNSSFKRSEL